VCSNGQECSEGHACQTVAFFDEKLCVAVDNQCMCTEYYVQMQAQGYCANESKFGKCEGVFSCSIKGIPSICDALIPTEEKCNYIDDDCDGITDEGFTYDEHGHLLEVGDICGLGTCPFGTVDCSPDGTSVICSTKDHATQEVCDGKDNDCDGQIDEDLSWISENACSTKGVCGDYQALIEAKCFQGTWYCNYDSVPSFEAENEVSCDQMDNDCNGETDEGFQFFDEYLSEYLLKVRKYAMDWIMIATV